MALFLVTLIPFGLVVLLYMTFPAGKDPVLQVEVEVQPRAWTGEDPTAARLLPSLILRNPTTEPWNNVNMSINEQFYFYHPDPMAAGEEIVVPLKFFHTKGNQYYPPESQPLKTLTVFAQVPSGARAIVELHGDEIDSMFSAQRK